jgi:coenzyme F420-dependent glucose-6-phosphate dehydrogenase
MTRYFLGAAQEQFPPEELLRHAVEAERAGFDGVSSSDHLQPWWEPGEAGHTWPWLGAAGALTDKAWATLERMFGERIFLGLGSGEALNEVPVGDDWPPVEDQIARMEEALSIIDRLWKGETLSENGRFYRTQDTKLHTLPRKRPPIWISAFGPKAAEVAGRWGDGLWTLPDPESTPEVIEAYRHAGGSGEIVFQALFSWAESDEAAMDGARMWKGAQPDEHYTDDWHIPTEMYENGAQQMSDEEFAENAIISSDPEHHVARIRELEEMGATVIVLQNNSGADPLRAIEVYGKEVLPALRRTTRPAEMKAT